MLKCETGNAQEGKEISFQRERGKGRQSRTQTHNHRLHTHLCSSWQSLYACVFAPREHKMRIKEHLPTNDVVETPCKFHSSSCPRFEARANQSKHVLGENRVQNQAGVRTAELMEALTRAQAGQTTDGARLSPAARQPQIHSWERLLGKGYRLRHYHSTMQGMCKLSL